MAASWAILLGLVLLLLAVRFVRKKRASYDELVSEYQRLDNIISEWRYPDGDLVPQEKRMRIMSKYRQAWRQVRNHPSHQLKDE